MAANKPLKKDLKDNGSVANYESTCDDYVHFVHKNVIETVFSVLPTETNERKKEQECRRKIKEKLIQKYVNTLIVDSSYVSADGKDQKQYTNTILVTEKIPWWQERIVENYKTDYILQEKELSHGHQILFKNGDNEKVLTLSFYPNKGKIMVQGSHDVLLNWINVFRTLCNTDDSSKTNGAIADSAPALDILNTSLDDTHDAKSMVNDVSPGQEKSNTHLKSAVAAGVDNDVSQEKSSTHLKPAADAGVVCDVSQENSNTDQQSAVGEGVKFTETQQNLEAAASTDNDDASEESILFHSFIDTDGTNDDENVVSEKSVPTSVNDETLVEDGHVPQFTQTHPTLKTYATTCKLKRKSIRTSLGAYKHAELKQRLDNVDGILAGLQAGILRAVESLQDLKQSTESGLKQLADDMKKIGDVRHHSPNNKVHDRINKFEDTINKKISKVVDQLKDSTRSEIGKIGEKVSHIEHNVVGEITEKVAHIEQNVIHEVKKIMKDNSVVAQQQLPSQRSTHQDDTFQMARATSQKTAVDKSKDQRTVLLIGDSTTKLMDKRHVLQDQTIRKCRAPTMTEAINKFRHGGGHTLNKVIVCTGLNDVRQGVRCIQIATDLKKLVTEIQKQYPGCSVYVCSILPVHPGEVDLSLIENVNHKIEDICKQSPTTHYINTAEAFMSHTNRKNLFERDGIHPNRDGTSLMMNCIRNGLLQEQRLPRLFNSSRTNNELSYAQAVSSRANQERSDMREYPHSATFPLAAKEHLVNHMMYPDPAWWSTAHLHPSRFPGYQPKMPMYMYPLQRYYPLVE